MLSIIELEADEIDIAEKQLESASNNGQFRYKSKAGSNRGGAGKQLQGVRQTIADQMLWASWQTYSIVFMAVHRTLPGYMLYLHSVGF